jgi:hypothetical protein
MRELESLLAERETNVTTNFDNLKHRIRCYAHIINICTSHIISSTTSPKTYTSWLSASGLPFTYAARIDSQGEPDDDDDDEKDDDIEELELSAIYTDEGDSQLKRWLDGIKRDPLRRARRVVRLLRSSDHHRRGFHQFVHDGNERNWFFTKDKKGKRVPTKVPEVQPLRDVKTRWDSVYLMLERLGSLQPVRLSLAGL